MSFVKRKFSTFLKEILFDFFNSSTFAKKLFQFHSLFTLDRYIYGVLLPLSWFSVDKTNTLLFLPSSKDIESGII